MKQDVFVVATDKRSVPANTAGTGTIVTFGKSIVGTSTLFKTEMKAGSYLVDLDQNECRKVVRVDSDAKAFLEIPFTSNLASGTPQIIPWYASGPKLISVYSSGNYELNGETITGGVTAEKTGNDRSGRRDLTEPVVIDATASGAQIEILY